MSAGCLKKVVLKPLVMTKLMTRCNTFIVFGPDTSNLMKFFGSN